MSWRLSVDPGECMGSGMCAGTAPDLFALDGDRSRPVREHIPEGDERALDAADICPMRAISVQNADGRKIGPRE
ncbi:ferredoxin [Streptomyces malaysiense]|uniref:Ferredoxin n=1 Tax=Streptomyces malaysiense TaxID=1428626 RepID=A0A1J4PTV6_9ACTN|nr:ferredoxin [Streptomyces malaysiense]OIK23550.1 cytochrome [Streptomyces malaysiense]